MGMKRINIAIDGPSGAGKSTAAKAIADELGIICLDTGAMYRAAGLKALRLGVDPCDAENALRIMADTDVDIIYCDGVQHIMLDGEDVTDKIRTQEVAQAASDISKIPEVRIKLAAAQRAFAQKYDVVMDGREIGTFVLPNAEYKFFVTASVEERARRRYLELGRKGALDGKSYDDIKAQIETRDYNDSTREFAPLRCADDAVVIDTTNMDEAQVCAAIIDAVRAKG